MPTITRGVERNRQTDVCPLTHTLSDPDCRPQRAVCDGEGAHWCEAPGLATEGWRFE